MWVRIARRFPIVAVPATHVYYRMSLESLSASVVRQANDCVALVRRMYLEAPDSFRHGESETLCRLYRYLAIRTVFSRRTPRRLWHISVFAYHAVKNRPRVSAVIFLAVLGVCTSLSAVGAHGALYRLSCRLPEGRVSR
jgi:hypothetical protein